MTRAPEAFSTGFLTARRLQPDDLKFAACLMARPDMNAHKPDPSPPTREETASTHARDLAHWKTHGVGRYLVSMSDDPIGLCGLTVRDGVEGLNISYHLSPDHWGQGHATALVRALVDLAEIHLADRAVVYGLVRPANPGSARVLEKCGFQKAETLMLGQASTTRDVRALDRPAP